MVKKEPAKSPTIDELRAALLAPTEALKSRGSIGRRLQLLMPEILHLIGKGATYAVVAERLSSAGLTVSPHTIAATVKAHRRRKKSVELTPLKEEMDAEMKPLHAILGDEAAPQKTELDAVSTTLRRIPNPMKNPFRNEETTG
jgi:hypothetical protein